MKKNRLSWFLVLCVVCQFSFAAAPEWKIVSADSQLSFTATQNGAPVTGSFKKFSGEIQFDPDQLSVSKIKIFVDVASVSDAYNQLADTLKTADWFNVKMFPQAVFESSEITKTGDKEFEAKGNLKLRDKTLPITLTFTQEEYSNVKARMKGETTIKRTAFGVGQGEWSDTNAVKDDVKVNFTVSAVKK
jgi:polyisoprenoid-binding protein YceI